MAIILALIITSVVEAFVVPASFHDEKPVFIARLKPVEEEPQKRVFLLVMKSRLTTSEATSFAFYEKHTDARCGGRCLPTGQIFQVTQIERTECGTVTYEGILKQHVNLTDDEPDTLGHLSPKIVVVDHSQDHCNGENLWEVEYVAEGLTRRFKGNPEAIPTTH